MCVGVLLLCFCFANFFMQVPLCLQFSTTSCIFSECNIIFYKIFTFFSFYLFSFFFIISTMSIVDETSKKFYNESFVEKKFLRF